jgi:hypothetical protein
MPQTVQRIGVEYNTAVAGMADELALLNVVRAKEGMPLHYTSVSRLSGSITLKATSGVNEQLKSAAPTATNTATTTTSSASIVPTIATTVTRSVLSGGNILTPSIGGEVDTGPSFDVAILDSQNFYNGILSPVPATTVANFIAQGFDPKVLLSLLVQKIDFKLRNEVAGVPAKKGDVLLSVSDSDPSKTAAFMDAIKCFTVVTIGDNIEGTDLTPLSRITADKDGKYVPLQLKDVASLDGVGLGLSAPITADPKNDKHIEVVRPSKDKQIVRMVPNRSCPKPSTPPADAIYTDHNKVLVAKRDAEGRWHDLEVDPQITITFRSPEGTIRFLGDCLNAAQVISDSRRCAVQGVVLFSLGEGEGLGAISTRLFDREYYIPVDDQRGSFQTLALIEQLISLQQSEADKPVTVPVQLVP